MLLLPLLILLVLAAVPADQAQARSADDYIVIYEPSIEDPEAATARRERAHGFKARLRYDAAIEGFAARLTGRQVERLRDDPRVAAVAADRPVHPAAEVPFAGGSLPTGVQRLRASDGAFVRGASSVRVAVLDTGVDLGHPDLDVESGTDCVDGDGRADDESPDGHGTHVAGIVGARNDGSGVVGVAPGTRIVAVRVLPGRTSDLICGIDWVTATRTDGDAGNDITVANMSLGTDPATDCGALSSALRSAIQRSTQAGITYVVSAGNEATAFDRPCREIEPAVYPEVLTVSAMSDTDGAPGGRGAPCSGSDDSAAAYSNFAGTPDGATHTIAAPGSCIESTAAGGGTHDMSGTSMAAPHVAGLAALCLGDQGQTAPCAGRSPAEVIEHLRSAASGHNAAEPAYGFDRDHDDLGPDSGRYYGHLAAPPPPDREGPAVTVDAPAHGSAMRDTAPALSGRAGTAPGDHQQVTVDLFTGSQATGSPQALSATRSGSGWQASLPGPLADGAYTVRARQGDARGNHAIAQATFTVDTVAPAVALDAGPTGPVLARDVAFSFSSEPGAAFECSLDGAPYAACASPARYPSLAPGGHQFAVRAVDRAGNRSAPASRAFTVAPPPPPPPPAARPAPRALGSVTPVADRFPAKLEIARSRVLRRDRALDVLAPITGRASGTVEVTFRAAGRTTRFEAPVDRDADRVRFRHALPRAQARMGTGIVTLRYPGNDLTRPQEVRLRAASRHADLALDRPTLSGGRLRAEGTISRRARGVVRVQLDYFADGAARSLELTARIRDGRWKLAARLPADVLAEIARRQGSLHSYTLFTGYLPARVRGEMHSYRVLPPR